MKEETTKRKETLLSTGRVFLDIFGPLAVVDGEPGFYRWNRKNLTWEKEKEKEKEKTC